MEYVLNSTNGFVIPENYEQSFQFPPVVMADKIQVLKLVQNQNISEDEIKILKFLTMVNFATQEQLVRYCEVYRLFGEEGAFRTMMKHLMSVRMLNRFMMGSEKLEKTDRIPHDAKCYYCATAGAAKLLEHMSTSVSVIDWDISEVVKPAGLVARNVLITELYLRLEECCPGRLWQSTGNYFRSVPKFAIARNRVVMDADFRIASPKDEDVSFVCSVFRKFDNDQETSERLERIESLLTTQGWKKYFPFDEEEPIFILLCDTDETVTKLAEMMSHRKITRFYFTTTDRMQEPLGQKGAFLKYDMDTHEISEAKAGTFAFVNAE